MSNGGVVRGKLSRTLEMEVRHFLETVMIIVKPPPSIKAWSLEIERVIRPRDLGEPETDQRLKKISNDLLYRCVERWIYIPQYEFGAHNGGRLNQVVVMARQCNGSLNALHLLGGGKSSLASHQAQALDAYICSSNNERRWLGVLSPSSQRELISRPYKSLNKIMISAHTWSLDGVKGEAGCSAPFISIFINLLQESLKPTPSSLKLEVDDSEVLYALNRFISDPSDPSDPSDTQVIEFSRSWVTETIKLNERYRLSPLGITPKINVEREILNPRHRLKP